MKKTIKSKNTPSQKLIKKEDYYVPINLDNDVIYAGDTEREKELNKELLSTILELNTYQDSYDKMKTVDDIKERIEELKPIANAEETNFNFVKRRNAELEINILEWVLNGSRTVSEKEADLPKAGPEETKRIINNMRKKMP